MKYFTKELLEDRSPEFGARWDNAVNLDIVEKVKARPYLSKKAQAFFYKISLHDGLILSCTIGNRLVGNRSPQNFVEIRVGHWEEKYIYTLRYTKVATYKIDYRSKYLNGYIGDPPRECEEDVYRVGIWLYDELSLAKPGRLRHEILLSEAASILIEFGCFSYSREKK